MSFYDEIVPRLRHDSRLDTFHRCFLLLLADVVDDATGTIHMSIEELSREVHISEGKIQPSVILLDQCGYIIAEKRHADTGHLKWHIAIKGYPAHMRQQAKQSLQPIAITKTFDDVRVSLLIEQIENPLSLMK